LRNTTADTSLADADLINAYANLLQVSEHGVRVIAPDVGGGFGGKASLYQEEIVIAVYAEAIFTGIADVLEEAGIVGGNVQELIHGTTTVRHCVYPLLRRPPDAAPLERAR
jgi:hypothetical protein